MNELNEIDQALLKKIKRSIEQKAGLSGSADLSQKDFDFLLYYIQERTGQALSLTTVKRIWRDEYQRLPHLSTLNMFAQIAYDKDWYTIKKEFLEGHTVGNGHQKHDQHISAPKSKRVNRMPFIISLLIGVLMLFILSWYYVVSYSSPDTSKIQFSAVATADLSIPNTVVFSYDVKDFDADHFYIQQSWDPAKTVEVFPNNKKQTDIYYEPGYHYAKLLANDRILKETPVHIRYKDWFVRFRYPDSELVKINETDLNMNGYLGLKKEYASQLSFQTPFQLGYMLSRDFDLTADEFQIEAAIKFDSIHAPSCPMVNLLIKGDKDYAWVTLGNKGCESNLGLIVGSTSINGKTNDLSQLGMDAFSWQKIQMKLSKGKFRLLINNNVVYEDAYSKPLGELKEIDFFFNGIGSIDEIKIIDNNDQPLLSQSFN